jgi:hypothetical protein
MPSDDQLTSGLSSRLARAGVDETAKLDGTAAATELASARMFVSFERPSFDLSCA